MTEISAVQSGEGGDDSAVIGAVVGSILGLIIVIVIVIFFVWRHRRNRSEGNQNVKQYRTKKNNRETSATISASSSAPTLPLRPNAEAEEAETPGTAYLKMLHRNTVIAVENLRTYLHNYASDNFLRNQFESVPMANSFSHREALSAQNSKKNLFKSIVPYDNSRVMLQVDTYKKHEDYINASFVKGYNSEAFFIASQAPNNVTLHDFVRMLWEKQVDRVVMLTNLIEDRQVKCTMYWPEEEEEEVTFGEIKVKLLTTKVFAEYTIREMQLSKKRRSLRALVHFHFTAWPEKSVPDSPCGLVDFHQRVLASPGSGPLLVHCSNGVGRTGTFIALCYLLQEAETTGKMDFLSTLKRLRHDRMKMIHTFDQYKFLHHAALVGHMAAGTNIPVQEICERFKKLESHQNNGYKQEFDALSAVCVEDFSESTQTPDDKEDGYEEIQTVINKQKNRLGNFLPKNAYMPELMCEVKTMDKYINAVLVPTRHNILTQLPLPSTVTDFWRLVTQYKVGLVVAFQADLRHTDETIGDFLPSSESEPMRGAVFEIHATIKEEHRLWQELSVTVSEKKKTLLGNSAEQHHLTCLLCKNSTLDPETVVEYLQKVKLCKPSDQLRTLYTCRNGADICGLMCVQSILLDKLEAEQCLAVPLVVGAIKAIRPQVITTLDEYMCLYKVLRLICAADDGYGILENEEPQQSKRDASINKAVSSSHTNPAFQQEEPDNSLKSYVNTKIIVSVEQQPGILEPQTDPVLMKEASNKPTASSVATAAAGANVVVENDVLVDAGGGTDTYVEMNSDDMNQAPNNPTASSVATAAAGTNVAGEYDVLVDAGGETDTYVEMNSGDPCSAKEHSILPIFNFLCNFDG
ncbi:receptor-type tyrosine-protein phosphatase kappa-like [Plakobranchus ocellatus]|uniref:protein-tyrosine-phosphatase n=1 Tax=Plakobranchus ocellatus TaxID=259542 RepID=A0AAV4A0R2_9GAST|nr:receptor-type tyrosine-protein phosphatase kappa-like [Plakobranchus ocellatus]